MWKMQRQTPSQLLLLLVQILVTFWSPAMSCSLQSTRFEVLDVESSAGTLVGVLNTTDSSLTIDREASNTFSVPISLLSNNSMVLTDDLTTTGVIQVACSGGSKTFVSIILVDIDNNPPVWEYTSYSVSVSETQTVPFILPFTQNPTASDADGPDSGQKLNYTILSGPYSDYFGLENPDQTRMNITLLRSLDFESVQKIVLTLQVNDYNSTGHKLFEVNATLTVTVVNADDVNPVWINCTGTDPCYVREINSNDTAGSSVMPAVSAKDGDLHLNAQIEYSILSQSPSDIVSVNNITGELTLTQNLPNPGVYTILLFATQTDNPNRRTEAKLRITVTDTGYTTPVFTHSIVNVTVSEDAESGQQIATVTAKAHQNRQVTYQLINNDTSQFTVDSQTGTLSLKGSFDYETVQFYSVTVSASDSISTSTATVNVRVTDVNEFNPQFSQSAYTFTAARRERGLQVGRVNATDGDKDSTVTYVIGSSDYQTLFSVNVSTGIVSLNADGSSLPEKSYTFRVDASDGSRTRSVDVTVNFGTALASASTASVSIIAIAVLASVFGVIVLAAVIASVVYRCSGRWKSNDKMSGDDTFPYENSLGLEESGTSQQDNPIEGYNNFMFGDDDAGIGSFSTERDQGEMFVTDSIYANEIVDYSNLTNGSIHTFSGSSSLVSSQKTLIPRQLHNGSHLQVVQVENAIDAASVIDSSGNVHVDGDRRGQGLTVYY